VTKSDLVGVDAALDFPLQNTLKPVVKGSSPPSDIVAMYHRRKLIEQNVLSSHGDATRYFVTFWIITILKNGFGCETGEEHSFDDQVTMALACLYTLPGIPCLYYGTEQGLHGHGSDPAVREAVWVNGLDSDSFFYNEISKIAKVRNEQPALRYGRFISARYVVKRHIRHLYFFTSVFGVLPILNDVEIIIVANTNTSLEHRIMRTSVHVILEGTLSDAGDAIQNSLQQ